MGQSIPFDDIDLELSEGEQKAVGIAIGVSCVVVGAILLKTTGVGAAIGRVSWAISGVGLILTGAAVIADGLTS